MFVQTIVETACPVELIRSFSGKELHPFRIAHGDLISLGVSSLRRTGKKRREFIHFVTFCILQSNTHTNITCLCCVSETPTSTVGSRSVSGKLQVGTKEELQAARSVRRLPVQERCSALISEIVKHMCRGPVVAKTMT